MDQAAILVNKKKHLAISVLSGLYILFTTICLSGQESSKQNEAEQNHGVNVRYELNADDSYTFFASNPFFLPYTIRLDFPVLENLSGTIPVPVVVVLEPGEMNRPILVLRAGDGERTGFVSESTMIMGNVVDSKPDPDFPYIFPFAHGTKHEVGQGFNGRFTHYGQNQFAVDFTMDEGTPVHAAREGIVAEIKEDSDKGGPNSSFDSYGNYISIAHSDGTFGTYVHLKKDGALVEAGQFIQQGQLIGLSGNTGRSSGPHLHFDVRISNQDGKTTSIPIKFTDYNGSAVVPQEHQFYYSTHSGMEPYQVLLGSNLSDSDFSAWIAAAITRDAIQIRHEQVDNTWVVFASNGFSKTLTVQIDLKLINFNSSRGRSFSLTIPAGAEVFATILRPTDPGSSSSYSARARY